MNTFAPQHVYHAVSSVARQALGPQWDVYGLLLEHWTEIMGPHATRVTPVKLAIPTTNAKTRHATGGTLTLRLPRGLAMEMQYQIPDILKKVNTFLGHEVITRIAFVHETRSG